MLTEERRAQFLAARERQAREDDWNASVERICVPDEDLDQAMDHISERVVQELYRRGITSAYTADNFLVLMWLSETVKDRVWDVSLRHTYTPEAIADAYMAQ